MFIFEQYPFSSMLSFFVFMTLAVASLRFRKSPGYLYFLSSILLTAFLSFASILELLSSGLQAKLFWRNLEQIPLFVSPITFYALTRELILGKGIRRPQLVLISVPVAIYLVLIFTDQYHHYMRSEIMLEPFGEAERIQVESTNVSMLFLVYIRVVGLWTMAMLIVNLRKVSGFYRKQHLIVIAGYAAPYVAVIITMTLHIDVSISVLLIPTGVLLFFALFQYKLLLVRPMAKDIVIEHMKEGIVIVDRNHLIMDMNPAAIRPLIQLEQPEDGVRDKSLIGSDVRRCFRSYPQLLAFYSAVEQGEFQFTIGAAHYAATLIPIFAKREKTGLLLILADITDRKKYESYLLERATVDGLTKLYNRQYYLEAVSGIIAELGEEEAISLLLLDIDEFKQINDRYGHQTGDRVLEIFSRKLKEISDMYGGVAGRMGGEEFAAAFRGTELCDAYRIAELIRTTIEQLEVELDSSDCALRFTVSIGLAAMAARGVNFKELYRQADKALYISKRSGRNRSTQYAPLQTAD